MFSLPTWSLFGSYISSSLCLSVCLYGAWRRCRCWKVPPPTQVQQPTAALATTDLDNIERLLKKYCVAQQIYLQHDLTLDELAQAIGTNRSYLSQYFSRQSITYNTYINNLRINHFISRYEKATAAGQNLGAQQLAEESGFRSYRTFSRAFTQRTGQSVTDWMREEVLTC